MNYLELLRLAAPELVVVVTALVVLAADLLAMRELELKFRLRIGAMIASVGCLVSIGWMSALPQHTDFLQGTLVADPMRELVQVALLVLTIFTMLLSMESDFTIHVGEYYALVLLAAVGMMFLVSSEDILMIFVSLELTSLSLYILTAFNKRSMQSAEAALKYFLFGGLSAAFTLFGLSLLYGLSGSTNLAQIAAAIHGPALDPLLLAAIVLTVIGFGFKVAAAPFHLWAPDVYQGAPIPSAAFIASGSKVASFFVFARVMTVGFKGAEGSGAWHSFAAGWVPVLAIVALLSMVLGNLAALAQSSVRRLLAYSAIAHGGYMLLAIMTQGPLSLAALMYYSITYGLTAAGAFGVVSVVQEMNGGDRLSDFAGLSRRAPAVSLCMMVFMLSLAGIPPLAGFFGKFYVFAEALKGPSAGLGMLWLVIFAIAMSAVSLYYYLQVLKQIYVVEAGTTKNTQAAPVVSQAVLAVLALAVLVLGCVPDWLVGHLNGALKLT
ncbi:MAG TPA: NADH-quinone oxidoreductase subunit N, partial [Verrucomicrobiae bacterium]|nr:NADH-quinone oxidoreductase subunit N [Verrucomicrobiae bacterium]